MKKVLIALMMLILMFSATVAVADEAVPDDLLPGGASKENALLITSDQYAKRWKTSIIAEVISGRSSWHVVHAESDGTFSFSTWNSTNYSIEIKVYNRKSEQLYREALSPNEELHRNFQVVAGEKLYILIGAYERTNIEIYPIFSVCFDGYHQEGIYSEVTKEPTCTEPGERIYPCELCFSTYRTEEIPALGHTPGGIQTTTSSCITEGKKVVHCSLCNELLSEDAIPMTDHIANPWVDESKATCTTAGLRKQYCAVCNMVLNSETPAALGHTPGEWRDVQSATCTADGSRSQYCAACNIVLATEAIPAHGHRTMDWQTTREAACLQSGLREKKCSDCGLTLESEQLNALGHSYTEWETLTEPTKELEGEKRRHCINCGDTQFEQIEKIPKVLGIF